MEALCPNQTLSSSNCEIASGSRWPGLAIVAGLFYADVHHHIYVSETPYLFLLGWASLRLRGMRWIDVGLARPRSWGKAILLGVAVGVATGRVGVVYHLTAASAMVG